MFVLRRRAVQAADRLGAVGTRGTRRYASSEHGHDAHHHDAHHHAAPKNEPLGAQFYIVLAAIPASWAIYKLSRPSTDGSPSPISKLIGAYHEPKDALVARNALHTAMAEQAAFDKQLFQNEPGTQHVELKFPEVFNSGSPYNAVAGHRARNRDELVAHYEKIRAEVQEKKTQRLLAETEKAR